MDGWRESGIWAAEDVGRSEHDGMRIRDNKKKQHPTDVTGRRTKSERTRERVWMRLL